jgi:hypothetical protein
VRGFFYYFCGVEFGFVVEVFGLCDEVFGVECVDGLYYPG